MEISRHTQTKQSLQSSMHMGRCKQILTARHESDPIRVVIKRRGQMIAGRQVLTHQNNIAKLARVSHHASSLFILPRKRASAPHGGFNIEPQRKRFTLSDGGCQSSRAARILRAILAIALGQGRCDSRIEEPPFSRLL